MSFEYGWTRPQESTTLRAARSIAVTAAGQNPSRQIPGRRAVPDRWRGIPSAARRRETPTAALGRTARRAHRRRPVVVWPGSVRASGCRGTHACRTAADDDNGPSIAGAAEAHRGWLPRARDSVILMAEEPATAVPWRRRIECACARLRRACAGAPSLCVLHPRTGSADGLSFCHGDPDADRQDHRRSGDARVGPLCSAAGTPRCARAALSAGCDSRCAGSRARHEFHPPLRRGRLFD